MPESYRPLRRVERDGMIACAVMGALAWALARWDLLVPVGVFGGGALAWISYRGIKGGIDAVAFAGPGGWTARQQLIGLVKFFTRYAILTVAAYVIMARLRLSPVAVVAGASSVVVAVAVEALRGSQWKS